MPSIGFIPRIVVAQKLLEKREIWDTITLTICLFKCTLKCAVKEVIP
jgi:hypothetical protein